MAKPTDAARKPPSPEVAAMNTRLFRAIATTEPGQSDREIARELKFSRSVIGNVRHGRNATFSTEIWRRFAGKYPDVAIDFAAVGPEKPGRRPEQMHLPPDGTINVRAEAAADLLRPGFNLPQDKQRPVTLPVAKADLERGAFGVRVHWPGAEELYAEGTILVCVPIDRILPGELVDGRRLIVQRVTEAGIEATVREIRIEANEASLWWRSTELEYQAPVRMPFSPGKPLKPWSDKTGRYRIVALVIWRAGEDAWQRW